MRNWSTAKVAEATSSLDEEELDYGQITRRLLAVDPYHMVTCDDRRSEIRLGSFDNRVVSTPTDPAHVTIFRDKPTLSTLLCYLRDTGMDGTPWVLRALHQFEESNGAQIDFKLVLENENDERAFSEYCKKETGVTIATESDHPPETAQATESKVKSTKRQAVGGKKSKRSSVKRMAGEGEHTAVLKKRKAVPVLITREPRASTKNATKASKRNAEKRARTSRGGFSTRPADLGLDSRKGDKSVFDMSDVSDDDDSTDKD